MGVHLVGPQLERAPVAGLGVRVLIHCLERIAEIVMQFGARGVNARGLAVMFRCLFVSFLLFEHHTQIAIGLDIIGPDRQCLSVMIRGLVGFVRLPQGVSEEIVGVRVLRIQGDNLFVAVGRRFIAAIMVLDCTEQIPSLGVAAIHLAYLFEQRLGFV